MSRGMRSGVLIAGGGLAGCLAALALARLRPDVPLLIVEERDAFGGERTHKAFESELDGAGLDLLGTFATQWPGYYVSFPGFSRNLRTPLLGFTPGALHRAMIETLKPDQYRLGTKVVAVRAESLVLDGGEEVKAEGALDARGPASLSLLEFLYEARTEHEIDLRRPHKVDRPVLIDASADLSAELGFMEVVPLDKNRLMIADVAVSERAQPDGQGPSRIERYLASRGWQGADVIATGSSLRPLPVGGDFDAFWRIGGARVAKLGLRGGFVQPATGKSLADAVRGALLLAGQREHSGAILHDVFEAEAKKRWRERAVARGILQAIAQAPPAERTARLAALYEQEPALIAAFHADNLGMMDRRKLQRAIAR